MPTRPSTKEEKLQSIKLNRKAWEALEEVAVSYRTSRTMAVNRAIEWMVSERWIPGYKRREEPTYGRG